MGDYDTKPPGTGRPVVRAGTQSAFAKDSADQAAARTDERYKGEAKRPTDAPPGGRRLRGNVFKDYEHNQSTEIEKQSK